MTPAASASHSGPKPNSRPAALMPHNIDAEGCVLGAMMMNKRALNEVLSILADDDFFADSHRLIFHAARRMAEAGTPVDPITIADELRRLGTLETVGGAVYIHNLVSETPTTENASHYARLVDESARRRDIINAATTVTQELREDVLTAQGALDQLQARLAIIPTTNVPRIKLYSISELRELPPAEDLIEGILSRNAICTLWGPSGHGKSLIALDLALSVACGRAWFGHNVAQGPVVMVVAEGVSATSERIDAWLYDRGESEPQDFHVVAEAVNLFREGDPQAFVRAIDSFGVRPSMVIFDTLARSMVGGDENNARDMGLVVSAGDWIRSKTEASIVIVHHSGRSGDHERGSTALYAACDTVMSAIRDDDGVVEIESRKQKDREDFSTIRMAMKPVQNSVVMSVSEVGSNPEKPPITATQILVALWQSFGSNQATSSQWIKVCEAAERSHYRARKWLVERGFVLELKSGRRSYYSVTELGQELLLP